MPMIIIRRVPLPSVSIYLILSASLLMLAVMWANNTLVEEQELLLDSSKNKNLKPEKEISKESKNKPDEFVEFWSYPKNEEGSRSESSVSFSVKRNEKNTPEGPFIGTVIAQSISDGNYSFAYGVLKLMLDEPLCLMLVVNATYCVLIVVMHVIQKIVFGKLRPIERQHIKDKFWNFVFYKFIFIFGVMNVQSLNEVLIWVSWFTAIAFLLLLTKLSKDRFEFLSFSPNTPMFYHWKVIWLLFSILFFCVLLGISCIVQSFPFSSFSLDYYDIHSITFMLAEAVMIAIKAIHVLLRYGIHLYDIQHVELWERKATLVYHVDLIMELFSLLINFIHHLHMLISGNIWLSMASLVICMQLRFIFTEIQKRYLRHKNYRRVVANMDAQFPAASSEELAQHEDRCAICWDQMESARKLPCGHLFHAPCLRSWLEQDTTCPTCRKQLGIRQSSQDVIDDNHPTNADNNVGNLRPGGVANPPGGVLNPTAAPVVSGPHRNHFWHFDGSRFASWLPSFSVEVTHSPRSSQGQLNEDLSNSQLDSMARDVQEIFPQIPARIIAQDLRVTGSVEATTNNILEGNIVVPPDQMVPPSPSSLERQSNFAVPLTTRSQPNIGASGSTLRHRHVTSHSDLELRERRNIVLPSVSTTETAVSSVGESLGETSSSASNLESSFSHSPTYGRFSKAPQERESVLQSRRDMMLRQARLKYLNKTLTSARAEPTVVRSDETQCASSSSKRHHPHDVIHTSSMPSINVQRNQPLSGSNERPHADVVRETSASRDEPVNRDSQETR